MSLLSKIQSLISGANAVTGKSDATLTAAVQSLVDGYGQGEEPVINPLSVTENGTYTAPAGVDGYSPVTVNVQGGGATEPYREDTIGADGKVTDSVLHGYVDVPESFFYQQSLTSLPTGINGAVRNIGGNAFSGSTLGEIEVNVSGNLDSLALGACGLGPKLKIKCDSMGRNPPGPSTGRVVYSNSGLKKVWMSKEIKNIYPSNNGASQPTFSLCTALTDIYTDAPSKPDGWWEYFNYTSASAHATVHYGVSEAEFDAL